jgi:hypothetical protein
MKGKGESNASSGREMAAQQEAAAVQEEAMTQPADGANERQTRDRSAGGQEAVA